MTQPVLKKQIFDSYMLRNMLLCLLTLLIEDQVGKKDPLVRGMIKYKKKCCAPDGGGQLGSI